jgi:putative transposase
MTARDARPTDEALFRYHVLALVRAYVASGRPASHAIEEIADLRHHDLAGRPRQLSVRTLYRWFRAFQLGGIEALEPERRERLADSKVFPTIFLEFCRLENRQDPEASVPELIARARVSGIIAPDQAIDRTTLWRTLRRLGVPVTRKQRQAERDKRPFEFPNRMLLTLADGKHFRAGHERVRRVALFFLDDATRYGLNAVAGTAESTEMFLRGLHATIEQHGLMNACFLDRGPGFISHDTHEVLRQLGVGLIHGEKAYPEGRGKIERFNQTADDKLLRGFDNNPCIDPDPAALTLRLQHWLEQVYNHTRHEGLYGLTPAQRWRQDPRPLVIPPDRDWLRSRFHLTIERTVSSDNVVSFQGTDYEIPTGYAGQRLPIIRVLLEPGLLCIRHLGHLVPIHPVDRHRNAYDRRARPAPSADADPPAQPVGTAANRLFDQDFRPLVDADGGYFTDQENEHDQDFDPEPD